ncbi:hypothetical protein Hamer_G008019 [Homarus americanus]|uniref:Uncharacterized protein n=1 Tax=Homarus americanus TaxID=6706 RepID=A0A8J5MSG2_HOMAM|nr:hypothetical protein Hamer_G008019 [Homarus americanus]
MGGEGQSACHNSIAPRPKLVPTSGETAMNLVSMLVLVMAALLAPVSSLPEPDVLLDRATDLQDQGWVQPPRFHYRGFQRPNPRTNWL